MVCHACFAGPRPATQWWVCRHFRSTPGSLAVGADFPQECRPDRPKGDTLEQCFERVPVSLGHDPPCNGGLSSFPQLRRAAAPSLSRNLSCVAWGSPCPAIEPCHTPGDLSATILRDRPHGRERLGSCRRWQKLHPFRPCPLACSCALHTAIASAGAGADVAPDVICGDRERLTSRNKVRHSRRPAHHACRRHRQFPLACPRHVPAP